MNRHVFLFHFYCIKKQSGPECYCFSHQINDSSEKMADISRNVLRSAASLAAVCQAISNQSQFISGPHKSCNPSNLFRTVTGERRCGEAHFVFVWLSYCQVADKELKLSPLPPQRIIQIRRTKVRLCQVLF